MITDHNEEEDAGRARALKWMYRLEVSRPGDDDPKNFSPKSGRWGARSAVNRALRSDLAILFRADAVRLRAATDREISARRAKPW